MSPQYLLPAARRLRMDMTKSERALWQRLRNNQLGAKFRRQVPLDRFIVDFVCFDKRLVIELDGSQHDAPEQRLYDMERTRRLEILGFRVLRYWNHQLLREPEAVLAEIWRAVQSPAASPSPRPSPARGSL